MTRRPTPAELAEPLRRIVAMLEAGDLTAGPTALAYLRGALAALEALATGRPVPLPDLTEEEP